MSMYRLKPIVLTDVIQDLPTCMYTLPQIQGAQSCIEQNGHNEDGGLAQLEQRQEAILDKLKSLQMKLDTIHPPEQYWANSVGIQQAEVIEKLNQLKETMCTVKRMFEDGQKGVSVTKKLSIAVKADPRFPPKSLPLLCRHLQKKGLKLCLGAHKHSSLAEPTPTSLATFLPPGGDARSASDLCVTLIWKDVGRDPECAASASSSGAIRGEANLVRLLCRNFRLFDYEESSDATAKADAQLDALHAGLVWGAPDLYFKRLAGLVQKEGFLGGPGRPNAADVLAFSAVGPNVDLPSDVLAWTRRCKATFG